jgi:hypothetical protein
MQNHASFAPRRCARALSLFSLGASVLLIGLHGAAAQDSFLTTINERVRQVKADRRSDTILLPLLAKLTPPPAEAIADQGWLFIDPEVTSRWPKVVEWASAEPQAAAIKALHDAVKQTITKTDAGMAFAIPYGAVSDAAAAVRLDLHVELGEPPTIAGANMLYLPRLRWYEMAIHVESTRLLYDGKPMEAINLLIDLMYLGRQMADRELSKEVRVGFEIMITAVSRIRDIAFEDFRHDRKLKANEIRPLIDRLFDDAGMWQSRIRFPTGDRIGIAQLIERAYGTSTEADPDVVGPMMARVASTDQPLKIFNEAAKWREVAPGLPPKPLIDDRLVRTYSDWETKWKISWWDPRMRAKWMYDQLDRRRFPIVAVLPNLADLFEMRQVLEVELTGARVGLGVLGYYYANRSFPPTVSSIRPQFAKVKEGDPYNPEERDRDGVAPLQYLRPVTDTNGKPHDMRVVTGSGLNFVVPLKEDVWVLFSVGSDGMAHRATVVQNTSKRTELADYLLWPPMEAVTRKHLKQTGVLK